MLKSFKKYLNETLVGEKPITSIESYLKGMSKGLTDKLFFLDKIDFDCLVDFGSADGYILSEIRKIKPDVKLIGYDIDENMIEISKNKFKDIDFADNWNEINYKIKEYKEPAVFLSSVIHEVYSYSSGKDIKNFWNNIFNSGFEYIIIRDMMPSIDYEYMNNKDIQKVREMSDEKYLTEFEKEWGQLELNFRNLLHWFLKYSYTDNWDRELKENYVPITIETLKKKIPSGYRISYENHYVYEFLKNKIKKDFDITLKEPTHLKMIIKKNS
jgi:hypothetical protein